MLGCPNSLPPVKKLVDKPEKGGVLDFIKLRSKVRVGWQNQKILVTISKYERLLEAGRTGQVILLIDLDMG